jgi:predicted anti-sigma-YlaC factor YlaD
MDGEASPEMCRTIERHLRHCHRCSAVYDSTRKMLVITGDERVFEVPAGFSSRLHRFIRQRHP